MLNRRPFTKPSSFASLFAGAFLVLSLSLPSPVRAEARALKIVDDRVRLGDLSATLPQDLQAIDVGPAPAPGKRSRITRAGVRSALVRAGADPRLADSMPNITEVERASKVVDIPTLTRQIAQSLAPQLPQGVRIARINSVPELVLPVGDHKIQTKISHLASSMTITVKVTSQGAPAGSFPVQVLLNGTPKVPVLTKKVARNSIVKKSQVRMQPTQWSQVSTRSALFPEQLVGRRASQALPAGQSVSHSAVKVPPMVSRGHEVSVTAVGHGIHIVLPATAQEDGVRGQYIKVRPKTGTRTLRAKVMSPNEVRISLEGFR